MDPAALSWSLLCLLPGIILGDTNGGVRVVVKEDSDAILPCSPRTKENLSGALFDWRTNNLHTDVFMYQAGSVTIKAEEFKGRVSHFPHEVKNGNASIIIRNTKIEDGGIYTCDLPHLEPPQRFYIQLVVGASPKPNIVIVNVTEDRVQLKCEVQGASPKPEVEIQDSSGNVLPAEKSEVFERRRYTVILVTTVTKTGCFRCVAKQEEIHHETSAETYVPVYEDTCSKVDVTGWLSGYFLGVFSVVLPLLVAAKCIRIRNGGGDVTHQLQ
ncbi:Putative butyrophilin subfamily 2 member A3 [Larimichthys crocea]|uniref:Uncharacterized protein n=1 Tax=Larimichthys crocea TaxID=215358 RepID=A0ACD3QBK3_LARCR|nr:Putative butyrophilin subfamily 2 member A3 [Larimichthys crocea]